MSAYEDLSGRPIEVGSYIAYAALWDRCATLKYGRVAGLAVRKDRWSEKQTLTIRAVSVDRGYKGWALQNNGKPVTLAFLDRLLVVDARQVAPEALALLDDDPRYTLTPLGESLTGGAK